MRVLVTGASGFVGRHVVACLQEAGDEVAGTCWGECANLPSVELHELDLGDRPGFERLLAAFRPDAVVHLAGLSHVGRSWGHLPEYYTVNVAGTENLLRAARGTRGADGAPPRVIIASSAEVYGAVPEAEQPLGEERVLSPGTPYALTKAACERLALALAGESAIVVRSFNLIGPGQAKIFALPSFAAQLAEIRAGRSEPVLAVGNLAARRDFVHVGAAARAFALLVRQGEPGTVYNLASGEERSIAQALDRLIEVSGLDVRLAPDPERMRPVDQPLLVGDPGRLRALGWAPTPDFDAAIHELWDEAVTHV